MSKRKSKKKPFPGASEITPGDRKIEIVHEADDDGRRVCRHRVVDSIGHMLRTGTIDQGMHDAARVFQSMFSVAALESVRATPLEREPGSSRPDSDLTDRQVEARKRVHKALEAVGGISSPGGSAVWFVVGLQNSVTEWAMRQGWGGRLIERKQALGILVAALGMLASHLGHSREKPVRIGVS